MRIFGLILAGGAGRRMGGADKALVPFGAGTLLSNAVERFEPQVEMLALSANGDPAMAPFCLVVVGIEQAAVREAVQSILLVECVANRIAECILR